MGPTIELELCSIIILISLHAGAKFLFTITSPEIATCGIENGIQPCTNVCLIFL